MERSNRLSPTSLNPMSVKADKEEVHIMRVRSSRNCLRDLVIETEDEEQKRTYNDTISLYRLLTKEVENIGNDSSNYRLFNYCTKRLTIESEKLLSHKTIDGKVLYKIVEDVVAYAYNKDGWIFKFEKLFKPGKLRNILIARQGGGKITGYDFMEFDSRGKILRMASTGPAKDTQLNKKWLAKQREQLKARNAAKENNPPVVNKHIKQVLQERQSKQIVCR